MDTVLFIGTEKYSVGDIQGTDCNKIIFYDESPTACKNTVYTSVKIPAPAEMLGVPTTPRWPTKSKPEENRLPSKN